MERAMQLALERCPKSDDVVVEARRAIKREIFCQGYAAAENTPPALTWEDVRTILDKENEILHECNDNAQQIIEVYPKEEDYYREILKRFNEQRKK